MNIATFDIAEKQASLCRVIGNSRRLLILWELSKEELCVNEIAARVGSTLQNVSQHLGVLKKNGIVVTRRQGQVIFYQLANHECVRNCLAQYSQALDKCSKVRSSEAAMSVDIPINT